MALLPENPKDFLNFYGCLFLVRLRMSLFHGILLSFNYFLSYYSLGLGFSLLDFNMTEQQIYMSFLNFCIGKLFLFPFLLLTFVKKKKMPKRVCQSCENV